MGRVLQAKLSSLNLACAGCLVGGLGFCVFALQCHPNGGFMSIFIIFRGRMNGKRRRDDEFSDEEEEPTSMRAGSTEAPSGGTGHRLMCVG